MIRQLVSILSVALLVFLSGSAIPTVKSQTSPTSSASMTTVSSTKEAALQDAMRKLWEDHITWTRACGEI